MRRRKFDFSAQGRTRVVALTVAGTLFCICAAFAIDSYSLETGEWSWGEKPWNHLIIPLLLAPPLLLFLLSKLRELSIAHRELMTVASTDALTSLLNRRAFTALVDGYLERVERGQRHGAFLILDVDHFKVVNDVFGHEKGDEALKLVADTIRQNVREIDLVGRLGGEEFSVFMPGIDRERTVLIADRLRLAVKQARFNPTLGPHELSVSIGGITFDGPASFAELYREADRHLYRAKRLGRNRIEVEPFNRAA